VLKPSQSGFSQMIRYIFHSSSIYPLSKPFGILSRSVFPHIILISAAYIRLVSTFFIANIQIHNSSHFLYKIYTNELSATMTELSHIALETTH